MVARAHLALGDMRSALAVIGNDPSPAMSAMRVYAPFSAAPVGSAPRVAALLLADALMVDAEAALIGAVGNPNAHTAPIVAALCGIMYLSEGAFERALRAVKSGASLELLAIAVQVYLRIERPDLAEAALVTLAERDDESSLYQLSAAHTYCALGTDKAKEAVLIFRDVLERYGEGAGPAAQNGLAVALIAAKRLPEAEAQLAEAAAKDPLFPETLANTAALAALMGKMDVATKALEKLKKVAPNHRVFQQRAAAEASFARVAATFA